MRHTSMRRRTPVLLAISGVIAAGLTAAAGVGAATTPATDSVFSGQLLFADDFTGTSGSLPDPTKWQEYSACSYNPSAAFGSIGCGETEYLDGQGHMVIPATPSRGAGIRTGDHFGFTYGVISAWMRTPSQVGYWPAFWTLNSRTTGASDLPVGEVDAMEGYTTWDDVYHATVHSWTGDSSTTTNGADNRCAEGQGVSLSGGFNKYSAVIAPNSITFYFNDVQCGPAYVPSSDPNQGWAFGPRLTRPNWLILDLAVGGAGGQQKPATANAQLVVDRVEVRALPGSTATSTPATTTSSVPASTNATTSASAPRSTTTTATPTPSPTPTVPRSSGIVSTAPSPTPTSATPTTTTPITTSPITTTSTSRSTTTATTTVGATGGVVSGAWYTLTNACAGKVLEVPGGATAPGAALGTADSTGTARQTWQAVAVGGGYIKLLNQVSGQAVNVAYGATTAGARIIQYTDAGGPVQEWALSAVSGTSGVYRLLGHQSGLALATAADGTTAGQGIVLATVGSSCTQQWTLTRH